MSSGPGEAEVIGQCWWCAVSPVPLSFRRGRALCEACTKSVDVNDKQMAQVQRPPHCPTCQCGGPSAVREPADLPLLRSLEAAVAAFLPVSRLPDTDERRVAAERALEDGWLRTREGQG